MPPRPGGLRLLCYVIMTISTLVAVGFDLSIHLLALALAGLLAYMPRRGLAALTLLFVFSAAYGFLSVYYFSTGALFLTAILLIIWPYGRAQQVSVA